MRRLALVVAILAASPAHADAFLDDVMWFLDDQPFKGKRPDIAELTRERYELGDKGIVATTVEIYRTDATGRLTHTERRLTPTARRATQDITYDTSDRIERIHWVDVDQNPHDEVLIYEPTTTKSVIDGVEQPASRPRSSHTSYTIDVMFIQNDGWGLRTPKLVHNDEHGYPDRIGDERWSNAYDRASRRVLSSDGDRTRLYFWNSRADLVEVAEKRGGRIVAKTVYTYIYR